MSTALSFIPHHLQVVLEGSMLFVIMVLFGQDGMCYEVCEVVCQMATSKDHDSLRRGDLEWYDPLYAYDMSKKYFSQIRAQCNELQGCMAF
jgi:hypothetical protein